MSIWIEQGQLALYNAILVFFLTFVPMVIWQYRRFGRPSVARLLGAVAVASYVTGLLTYTWLPLPERDSLNCLTAPQPRFDAFHFVTDLATAVRRDGVAAALRSFGVWQVLLNVALFVPWGIIVRRYLHRGVVVAAVSGLVGSLVIEVAQLTGLFGIYPCAYRHFDVDDVILNTSGALIGALLAPVLLWWMPEARALRVNRHDPRPVTATRRWAGMALDFVLFFIGYTVMSTLAVGVAVGVGLMPPGDASSLGWFGFFAATVVPWVALFIVPPWGGWAASAGQYIVWLTPMWRGADGELTHGTLAQRLLRANVVAGPLVVALSLDEVVDLGLWLFAVPAVLLLASVALVPFTATTRSLSGWLLGAEMVDIRDVGASSTSR